MIKRTLGLASCKLYKLVLIQQHKIQGWVSLVSGPFSCPAYWQYYCGLQLQIWEDDIETRNPETYFLWQKHKTQTYICMLQSFCLQCIQLLVCFAFSLIWTQTGCCIHRIILPPRIYHSTPWLLLLQHYSTVTLQHHNTYNATTL